MSLAQVTSKTRQTLRRLGLWPPFRFGELCGGPWFVEGYARARAERTNEEEEVRMLEARFNAELACLPDVDVLIERAERLLAKFRS